MWGIDPSQWLHWFGALDWSHLDNVLSSIVGVTVLTGIGWAGIKFVWNPLSERLGRRRAQAKQLDQLACLSSIAYVESLFGAAQFVTYEDEREQRTYQLPGAWVMVEVNDARVAAFSITVTKRRMHYNTKRLTLGYLKVQLGKSKFGGHGIGYDGERLWIGAYRNGYLRTYDFRRSGAYQRFWLSYNMSGVGRFEVTEPGSDEISHWYDTGAFCEDTNAPLRHQLEPGLDASGTTINTLTVLAQDAAPEKQFLARNVLGPDESRTRMAATVKPPSDISLTRKLHSRMILWKYKIQGKTYRP